MMNIFPFYAFGVNVRGLDMFYCYDCGEFFEEPVTMYDGHGELDEGPIWEAYGACPYCESDQIDTARRCEICGEWTKPDEDVCDGCCLEVSLMVSAVKRLIKKRADRYKLDYKAFMDHVIERMEE